MDDSTVKRLALVFAVQAEIDGMNTANSERDLPTEAAAYSDESFAEKAEELRVLAAKHSDEL